MVVVAVVFCCVLLWGLSVKSLERGEDIIDVIYINVCSLNVCVPSSVLLCCCSLFCLLLCLIFGLFKLF